MNLKEKNNFLSFSLLPGIGIALFVGLIAKVCVRWAEAIGDVSLAILIGILLANVMKIPKKFEAGIAFSEKSLLSWAVMLMGFGLNSKVLFGLGWQSILVVIASVGLTIFSNVFIGRMLGLTGSLSLLLGLGNGICGASAIAAGAPLLTKDKDEIGIAVSVVNLLGTIGIFIIPAVCALLDLAKGPSGVLVGGSLQAVGHVVAAGYTVSPEVGELSVAVKMGRIFLLAPILVLMAIGLKSSAEFSDESGKVASKNPWYRKLPYYLYGFIFFALIGNIGLLPEFSYVMTKQVSHHLLLVAMAAIGLRIRLSTLMSKGPRALLAGAGTFFLQVVVLSTLVRVIS